MWVKRKDYEALVDQVDDLARRLKAFEKAIENEVTVRVPAEGDAYMVYVPWREVVEAIARKVKLRAVPRQSAVPAHVKQ